MLNFNAYSPSGAPVLFQPVLVNGERKTENPLNWRDISGRLFELLRSRKRLDCTRLCFRGLARLARNLPFAERIWSNLEFGFAYDPFGDGKSAIRGGVGRFVAMRTFSGSMFGYIINPPSIFYPTYLWEYR